jgi:hypothetical protein
MKNASTTKRTGPPARSVAEIEVPRYAPRMSGRKTSPGRYRGFWLHVTRAARTKGSKRLSEGDALLAIGDPGSDGWVPVLYAGRLDYVKKADVERIKPPKPPKKPSRAMLAARKRIVKRAGVAVSRERAKRISAEWRR